MSSRTTVAGAQRLLRNTMLSLFGAVGPAVVGLLTIPYLIRGLGNDAFGLMSLVWVVIGMFALLDFGTGRATTKFVAEYLGESASERIPTLFWTAVAINGCMGVTSGVAVIALAPTLTHLVLQVPPSLHTEAVTTFQLLGLSLPVLVVSVVLRGALEGAQRFDLTNAVQVPANSLNFLIPAAVVYAGGGLVSVVVALCVTRVLVAPILLLLCFRQFPTLRSVRVDRGQARALLRFGGWMTVSSVVGPILLHLDRVLIGALVGMEAVTFYAAPYEIVTRLTLLPASMMLVFFPAFSAISRQDRGRLGEVYRRSVKHLLLIMAPICSLLFMFAPDILTAWVGADFAARSASAMQVLVLGLLLVSLSSVPFNVLQASGRPDVSAKIHLIELPVYAVAAWLLVREFGILGAAIAWTIRASLDALLFHAVVARMVPARQRLVVAKPPWGWVLILSGALLVPVAATAADLSAPVLIAFVLFCGVAYVVCAWRWALDPMERLVARQTLASVRVLKLRT